MAKDKKSKSSEKKQEKASEKAKKNWSWISLTPHFPWAGSKDRSSLRAGRGWRVFAVQERSEQCRSYHGCQILRLSAVFQASTTKP